MGGGGGGLGKGQVAAVLAGGRGAMCSEALAEGGLAKGTAAVCKVGRILTHLIVVICTSHAETQLHAYILSSLLLKYSVSLRRFPSQKCADSCSKGH